MSFWDPKYLEEQKKRREEEERRMRLDREAAQVRAQRRAAQARKDKLAKKKKKQGELEEEEAKRREEAGLSSAEGEGQKEEWIPPVLNRGLGGGFGIQRLATNKDAQEQIKRNELERQRKALEEESTSSAAQDNYPKLNRPF